MNLPNKITIVRILLIPVMMVFMLPIPLPGFEGWNAFIRENGMIVALIIFSIAAYTDHLDGAIARKRNIVTNMGKFLDPIADKLLVLSAFICLVERGLLTSWVPVIVLFRELAVTGIRLLAVERGKVIAASKLGKLKTVTQIIAIIVIMLLDIIRVKLPNMTLIAFMDGLGYFTVFLALVMTIISGVDYYLKNKELFAEE